MNALMQDFSGTGSRSRETREWIESIEAVIDAEGTARAQRYPREPS